MNVFFTQHTVSMHVDYTINLKPIVVVVFFNKVHFQWRTPNLLKRFKCESKMKTTEE